MSFLSDVEAELHKAEDGLKAKIAELAGTGETAIKAELEKLAESVKTGITNAKAQAIAEIQSNEPGIAAQVQKYLDEIEAAVLASLGSDLVA